jgi:hypothetical protein
MSFVMLSMMRSLTLPAVRAQPITLLTVTVEICGRLLSVTGTADLESGNRSTGVIPRRTRPGDALSANGFSAKTVQAAYMELFEQLVFAAHLAALRQGRCRLGHESPISVKEMTTSK